MGEPGHRTPEIRDKKKFQRTSQKTSQGSIYSVHAWTTSEQGDYTNAPERGGPSLALGGVEQASQFSIESPPTQPSRGVVSLRDETGTSEATER